MPVRALARSFTPSLLLLALTSCTPRVPATIELDDGQAGESSSSKSKSGRTTRAAAIEFDVARALDGAERALLAVDSLRSQGVGAADYNLMRSYYDDEGLRSLYYYSTVAGLSIWRMGELFETPVFVSGPHAEGPDYDGADFGHYNIAWVEHVTATAEALAADPARVERTRAAFERQLRSQALTYLLVYEAMHGDPIWFATLEAEHEQPFRDWNSPHWEQVSALIEAFYAAGMSWAESETAVYFWLRREFDGTAVAWRGALDALLGAYGVDTSIEPPYIPTAAP